MSVIAADILIDRMTRCVTLFAAWNYSSSGMQIIICPSFIWA